MDKWKSINMYDWDLHGGVYKPIKGKRFSTVKKSCKSLIDDVVFLAALEGEFEHDISKAFMEYCNGQIYPLIESQGDEAGALALCSYLYCQLNEEKTVFAEVYDLFHQVCKSLEKVKEYKELAYCMSLNLSNMGYYIGLAGARSKSGIFRISDYNDDDRRVNWPIKLPKNLSTDNLLNVAWMLSSMVMVHREAECLDTVSFLGLTGVRESSRSIMEKVKEISESKNITKVANKVKQCVKV